jgi:TolB protein
VAKGYRHHIYLEGYELPYGGFGVLDPAPAPDGTSLYFSGMGWIWKLDLASFEATRVTSGGGSDTRPAVSPDGKRLAFLRDDTHALWIVLKDLATGKEQDLVRTGKIELDPAFSADGRSLFYTSSEAGDLDLWRVDLATGQRHAVTTEAGLELKPQPAPDGRHLVYLAKKRNGEDQVRSLDLESGHSDVLYAGAILSMTRPALSPDGQTLALALPQAGNDVYQLHALDLRDRGQNLVTLTTTGRPLSPAWSPDGRWIYFCEDDGSHSFRLRRAALRGGGVEDVPVRSWNWGVPTTTLKLRTLQGGHAVPARLEVVDAQGHALIPSGTPARFDNQNGRIYFHSQGEVAWTVPAGPLRITATRGFAALPATASLEARAGTPAQADLTLEPIGFPGLDRWFGGDLHFHMNYGGPYQLRPEDLVSLMRAEDLDVGEPMVANLQTRLTDREWLGWRKDDAPPLLEFGQEVRSNLFGHMGLAAIKAPFAPSFWGPDYAVIRTQDVLNSDALAFGRDTGAFTSYVHPTPAADPFSGTTPGAVPAGYVLDAVLGHLDALELSGLWTQELGASELYYQVLNAGFPLALAAGTDSFPNFYRCSVTGSNRAYAHVEGPCTLGAYYAALRQGRSFISSGPLADFRVEGALPGSVVSKGKVKWSLDLASALPVEHLEILVNGRVVETLKPLAKGGALHLGGSLKLPAGGWVAFRAWDDHSAWPTMNSRLFVHTSPHWIGAKGSTDPRRARESAAVLLATLQAQRKDLAQRPELAGRARLEVEFDQAEARLKALALP